MGRYIPTLLVLLVCAAQVEALEPARFRAGVDITSKVRNLTVSDGELVSAGPDAEGVLLDLVDDEGVEVLTSRERLFLDNMTLPRMG